MGQPEPRLTAPRGTGAPAVLASFPRRRQSLLLQLLASALGDDWAAAHPPSGLTLVEYEPFPIAAIARFEAAVARGEAEDSPEGFARFASEDFGTYRAFLSRWASGRTEGATLVIDLARFRTDPAPVIAEALALLDPAGAAEPGACGRIADRVRAFLEGAPAPDPRTFRHYDPATFAHLSRLVLRRATVQEVFRRVMGREIAERGILEMQTIPGLDELKRRLKETPEYRMRHGPPVFVPLTQAEPALLAAPDFHRAHRAAKSPLGWPLAQVFVSRPARLIYCPIGKVACTFLKRQMVRISDPPHAETILSGVHGLTDNLVTGLQLSDYPAEEAMAMATDPNFLRIAVLRDPADRLLSAYVEKFVLNRTEEGNRAHTAGIVAAVQVRAGRPGPDFDRGITFREFVTAVCAEPPERLDPHWRPQSDYLQGIDYDRLFPISALDAVVDLMEARSGRRLPRRAENATGSGKGILHAGAADLLPEELARLPRLHRDSFLEPDIHAAIAAYFAADIALVRRAEADAGAAAHAAKARGAVSRQAPNPEPSVWTGRA